MQKYKVASDTGNIYKYAISTLYIPWLHIIIIVVRWYARNNIILSLKFIMHIGNVLYDLPMWYI